MNSTPDAVIDAASLLRGWNHPDRVSSRPPSVLHRADRALRLRHDGGWIVERAVFDDERAGAGSQLGRFQGVAACCRLASPLRFQWPATTPEPAPRRSGYSGRTPSPDSGPTE